MDQAYREGHRVVWLHTGDPSPYDVIPEQMAGLNRRNIAFQVLSSGSAAFEAATLAAGAERTDTPGS